MSVGGATTPSTLLAGSIGGGAGAGTAALTGRKRIGTLLGGQPVSGTPAAPIGGGGARGPSPRTPIPAV